MAQKLGASLIIAMLPVAVLADPPQLPAPQIKVQNKVPSEVFAFPLEDVRLLDGPFKRAQDLDRAYLLSLDVDRLLHVFRVNAGLPSSAKPLGGWEAPACELRGHFVGHYLSGCALMYASTRDERLKARGDAVVAALAECQAKLGSGYLSAYPETFIDRVEKQQRVWAPYYTLHKIYAGLLDMYVHGGNQQALEVCRQFGDWVSTRNARLNEDEMQKMLANEHGGMNETLANLYALTGEEKYLKIAQRFNHRAVIGPASKREDKLTGLHANTQIPKFVGTARQFELTGDPSLKTASEFFWKTVVQERSYVIGGHSDGEAFSPKERLSTALGPATTETCNTYNMLKLTRHLFCWTGSAEYADYYERALINHILASQNPADGMTCYYVPLRSGMMRGGAPNGYCTPLDSFWCCTGTGVENHAKYGDSIYFWDGQSTLYVNLFIASELQGPEGAFVLRQETQFPNEDTTRFTIACGEPVQGALKIRHPAWATTGLTLTVNGVKQAVESKPGGYLTVERQWRDGDRMELRLPFALRTEAFRDNPRRFAFLHGPLVLCAQVDPEKPIPGVVLDGDSPLSALRPLPGAFARFAGVSSIFRVPGDKAGAPVTLEPFHQMHGQRPYAVYWDQYTSSQWQTREREHQVELLRKKEIEARQVDSVTPGNQREERAHAFKGEKTATGEFGGRPWRHASDGGWFSWDLKVLPDQPQELWITYWGSDGGPRVFDVLVDGVKLATHRLQNNKPNEFFDEVVPLPEASLKEKGKITVRFQAHPNSTAGGVFGVSMMKKR